MFVLLSLLPSIVLFIGLIGAAVYILHSSRESSDGTLTSDKED